MKKRDLEIILGQYFDSFLIDYLDEGVVEVYITEDTLPHELYRDFQKAVCETIFVKFYSVRDWKSKEEDSKVLWGRTRLK